MFWARSTHDRRSPKALYGPLALCCFLRSSMTICASLKVWKISRFSGSSLKWALKVSQNPFSHGELGSNSALNHLGGRGPALAPLPFAQGDSETD